MNRQKIGQFLFWLGIVLSLVWVALTVIQGPTQRVHTAEELRGTAYSITGFLFVLRITGGAGMAVSLVGVLLSSSKKGSYIWLLGFLPSFANYSMYWSPSRHVPALFGIGGTIILLSYLGILYVWAQKHARYQGAVKTGKQIQLLGYAVVVAGAQLMCMYFGNPHVLALAGMPTPSGESINLTLALGLLVLLIGHVVEARGSDMLERTQET